MTAGRADTRIVIVGAGIAGITALHVLRESGYTNVTVLEKGSGVGGVWYWNRYPGLTCDVPSQLYQFGFALEPSWSHVWASGEEIRDYHERVVRGLGLEPFIRLDTEVVEARWDEDDARWEVVTADGATVVADVLVCATGVLHHPAVPDIPGLDTFAGPVVHSARWDESVETRGRRIAVLGTGSTGVQLVSALQPDAASLLHFVRSPQWILWAPMSLRQFRPVGAFLRRCPAAHRVVYRCALWASGILADVTTRPSWRRRAVQAYARLSLRLQVRPRALRAALTPDYEPLCKRQVVSGTYYRAIQRPNARLVTDRIVEVTPTGLRTEDGRHHAVDVVVLATGFHAHHYMRPVRIVGRDGRTLDDAWARGPRAYRTTAIPGFPNLFTVLGPNSPTGSISLQHSAYRTSTYLVELLDLMRAKHATSVVVEEEATADFQRGVAGAMEPTVWNTGCTSWYLDEGGAVDLWPYDRATLDSMLSDPDPDHFEFR